MFDKIPESPMLLRVERDGDGVLVRCSGKLVAGVSDSVFQQIRKLIPGNKRIVLDLTELTHMDSTGLGMLVRIYVSARSAGCELILINLSQSILKVFALTNLLSVFTIVGEHGIKIG